MYVCINHTSYLQTYIRTAHTHNLYPYTRMHTHKLKKKKTFARLCMLYLKISVWRGTTVLVREIRIQIVSFMSLQCKRRIFVLWLEVKRVQFRKKNVMKTLKFYRNFKWKLRCLKKSNNVSKQNTFELYYHKIKIVSRDKWIWNGDFKLIFKCHFKKSWEKSSYSGKINSL